MSAGLILAAQLADQFGWRVTFFAVGAPGVLLALIMFLTVRETRERAVQPASQGQFSGLKQLLAMPTYRNMLIAFGCYSFASYATLQWAAAFFIRVHELPLSQVGWWVGTGNGLGSIVGIILGGVLGGYLVKRDRRWELWAPALTIFCAAPAMLAMLIVPNATASLACLVLSTLFASFGGAVALAAVQSLAHPWQRATASAVTMLVTAIVGFGAGPAVAGLLSDLFMPLYGNDSLRYALMITTLGKFVGAFHYYKASRTMMRDKVD
jgi:predicted MFS family arabinose efflux permease